LHFASHPLELSDILFCRYCTLKPTDHLAVRTKHQIGRQRRDPILARRVWELICVDFYRHIIGFYGGGYLRTAKDQPIHFLTRPTIGGPEMDQHQSAGLGGPLLGSLKTEGFPTNPLLGIGNTHQKNGNRNRRYRKH